MPPWLLLPDYGALMDDLHRVQYIYATEMDLAVNVVEPPSLLKDLMFAAFLFGVAGAFLAIMIQSKRAPNDETRNLKIIVGHCTIPCSY